jgi:hypothetical protein
VWSSGRALGPQPALSELFIGFIPLWLDAGYRINPHLYLGAYFQYGVGLPKNCVVVSCSGQDLRFGIDGRYHFLPQEQMDPWVGVGFGYEILGISGTGPGWSLGGIGFPQNTTLKGFELLRLQGGLDFKIAEAFHAGPFLAFSLFGRYSSEGTSSTPGSGSGGVVNEAFQGLFTVGVRGTFAIR